MIDLKWSCSTPSVRKPPGLEHSVFYVYSCNESFHYYLNVVYHDLVRMSIGD